MKKKLTKKELLKMVRKDLPYRDQVYAVGLIKANVAVPANLLNWEAK